jgi:hypothetical protein
MRLLLLFLLCTSMLHLPAHSQGIGSVQRDIPISPTIVVVPTAFDKASLHYADQIEEFLLSCRLRIVQRPSIKQVTETKGATKAEAEKGASMAGGRSLTEQYVAYEETGAEYVLLTDADAERVKLIDAKTREIVATAGELNEWFPSNVSDQWTQESEKLGIETRTNYRIYKLLQAFGLPVKRF